jgi:hypothetical protein
MKGYELFAPAKLFAYLAAGRPILGILPADEAKRILREVGVSTVADVDSVSDIVSVLRVLLKHWQEHTLAGLVPDPVACQTYSAVHQARQLASALAGKLASLLFMPGGAQIPFSLQDDFQRIAKQIGNRTPTHTLSAHSHFTPINR